MNLASVSYIELSVSPRRNGRLDDGQDGRQDGRQDGHLDGADACSASRVGVRFIMQGEAANYYGRFGVLLSSLPERAMARREPYGGLRKLDGALQAERPPNSRNRAYRRAYRLQNCRHSCIPLCIPLCIPSPDSRNSCIPLVCLSK